MTVNRAGALSKGYFISYLNLIMVSRNCSLENAKELTLDLFFHNNLEQYGKATSLRFLEAYRELEKK